MKKKILKVLLLISLLCLVGIYPKHLPGNHTAVAEEAKNIKSESDKNVVKMNDSIQQTVKSWATAFCNRDGETLYKLFDPDKKNEFFQLKYVNSSKDDPEISFGVSSPWPWENDYQINIKDNTAIITYYAMVSDPHVYTWIEKLNLVRRDGLYYVSSEKLKTYDSITTKKELEESIGDFNSYNNKLNYINSGLAYNLNQNALNNTIGAYDALFSAKTAAPYLLNLSGGKCCVKKKYITCTIVQYSFADGDSVDIQMIQPFGKKGIWLVEKINTNKSEKKYDDIKKIESWYQKLNIKKLNRIKKVANADEVLYGKKGSTLLLASIPKEKVYLYGYAGGSGVILRVNNKYQLFRWTYTTPRAGMPNISYGDFDQDGKKEVAVAVYTGTGTGVSVYQLYIAEIQKDGTISAMEFTPYQYIRQLMEKVTAVYSQADSSLQFYIDGKKAGNAINLSSWEKDGYQYSGIAIGEQVSFDISQNKITLNFIPGCCLENVGQPQYDCMPAFSANVVYKDGVFSLNNIHLNE